MKRINLVAEYVRSSLWVMPAAGAALAVAAGLGAVALDHATGARLGFNGSAEAARSVLSTIAAAMITFTGLVFSITIVALQLASSQFSPRVMRTFLRDRASKVALATFVASFSFAFTVLRATRMDAVPGISVNLAIVLVFAGVGVFIYYINHMANSIRAVAIIEAVATETRACVERCVPAEPPPALPEPELGSDPVVVANEGDPGVLTGFDADRIVAVAAASEAVVVSLGQERTLRQDPAFGLRQLVDLAARALSPGINDPTTAVQAIDQIHDLMRRLATRPMPSGRVADDEGTVRLVLPSMDWEGFVSLATDEIRIYGAGSLQVMRRLRGMIEDLLVLVDEERRRPLREQRRLLTAAAGREFGDERDRRMAGLADAQGLGS